MTATVYRWLSEAGTFILDQSGAGLVACWLCAIPLLWGLAWAIVTIGGRFPGWWRGMWTKIAQTHARWILKNGPIPFERRK